MSFIFADDIENLFVNFDVDLIWDLSCDLTCCLSTHWADWDDLADLISDLTDDFAVKASTQSMTCEAEKDSILVSENRDFYV